MRDTVVVIMGGGQGSRLFPLTRVRSKPAVPIAGKYRLIDIPVSNAINSDLRKIFILTQFNSASLNSHVARTYRFDGFTDGSVEILAAEQTSESGDWFQGTADAVRKHMHRFNLRTTQYVLILAGDQLYRMDYQKLISQHQASGAAVTVGVVPVRQEQASGFGVLKVDDSGRIVEFKEKPKDPATLDHMRCPSEMLQKLGFDDPDRPFLASMGIYLFNLKALEQSLANPSNIDFGHDIIPDAIHTMPVNAYIFDDYWEDIGTIRAFYDANLDLVNPSPQFHFYNNEAPIYTRPRYLPGSKVYDCQIHHAIISEGCLIRDSVITNSVIGIRSRINRGTQIRDSILMGADYYEPYEEWERLKHTPVPLGIGEDVVIEKAIVDKNARIGDGAIIRNIKGVQHQDGENYYIRDGIVVIPKDAVILPGTQI